MSSTQELRALLANGDRTFADLLVSEQNDLAVLLRPGPNGFSKDQKQLLSAYLLQVPERFDLEQENQGRSSKIGARTAEDGREYVPAKLLTSTREGEAYKWAWDIVIHWIIKPSYSIEFPTEDEFE